MKNHMQMKNIHGDVGTLFISFYYLPVTDLKKKLIKDWSFPNYKILYFRIANNIVCKWYGVKADSFPHEKKI